MSEYSRPTSEHARELPVRPLPPEAVSDADCDERALLFEDIPAERAAHGRRKPRIARFGKLLVCAALGGGLIACAVYFFGAPPQTPHARYTEAVASLNSGDAVAGYTHLSELANTGHVPAYAKLAVCYAGGIGTSADVAAAVHWCLAAEKQGDSSAVPYVADKLHASADYAEAASFYTRAESLTPEQTYACARCYYNLVQQATPAQSSQYLNAYTQWLTRAAELGVPTAHSELATCYYKGMGVPESISTAIKWYTVAAERGEAEAQFRLAWCYRECTPADEAKAFHWLTLAAQQGAATPQYDLAVCYLSGCGTPVNHAAAVEWLQKAALQQHPAALRTLAFCYRDGSGLAADPAKAVACFYQAAVLGDAEAQYNLAWCLHKAYFVEADLQQAQQWYEKAAKQGYAPAESALRSLHPSESPADLPVALPEEEAPSSEPEAEEEAELPDDSPYAELPDDL